MPASRLARVRAADHEPDPVRPLGDLLAATERARSRSCLPGLAPTTASPSPAWPGASRATSPPASTTARSRRRSRRPGTAAPTSYAPFVNGSVATLGVETPVYRSGVVPATVAERRRAFVGWLGELLVPGSRAAARAPGPPEHGADVPLRQRFERRRLQERRRARPRRKRARSTCTTAGACRASCRRPRTACSPTVARSLC